MKPAPWLATFALSLAVGLLYTLPLGMIERYLAARGEPAVLTLEGHRNDLQYLARAREVYDGHFPPSGLFAGESPVPSLQNPLPPLLIASALWVAGGDVWRAFLLAVFVFSQANFLALYWLGRAVFAARSWAYAFALIGALTPAALRIFNFDGTA